ncbi:MAG: hypothetical protein WCE81_07830 [Halobacteriota archaeon]
MTRVILLMRRNTAEKRTKPINEWQKNSAIQSHSPHDEFISHHGEHATECDKRREEKLNRADGGEEDNNA